MNLKVREVGELGFVLKYAIPLLKKKYGNEAVVVCYTERLVNEHDELKKN